MDMDIHKLAEIAEALKDIEAAPSSISVSDETMAWIQENVPRVNGRTRKTLSTAFSDIKVIIDPRLKEGEWYFGDPAPEEHKVIRTQYGSILIDPNLLRPVILLPPPVFRDPFDDKLRWVTKKEDDNG